MAPPPATTTTPGSLAAVTPAYASLAPSRSGSAGAGALDAAGGGATAKAPVFACWQDSTDVGVDTLLSWDPAVPDGLPDAPEAPICVVRLRSPETASEFLEARLQRHHLQGLPESWPGARLRRLQAAMARPAQRCSSGDTVILRREPGRMVIDVLFRDGESSSRVVEILNAYASGGAPRSEAVQLLRSVALAQRTHRESIRSAQRRLELSRASLKQTEAEWAEACRAATAATREQLSRFALLLQAKIDKERALHAAGELVRLCEMT
eukprot:TRINITY_DN16057_c1_g2_i1.p1 TRINITY_DN16057_c1_g2~~TRINITY_DN16057_c1_g2_i1.p1  ORF type:complete len:280 (-),score=58.67 TRINITY_DN16057_c1_g2_i1:75-872(-)